MPGDDKSNNRMTKIQESNKFQQSVENTDRNTSNLAGSNRPYGNSSSISNRTTISDGSPMDTIKSLFKGGNNSSSNNSSNIASDNSGFRSKTSNGTFGFPSHSASPSSNQQLTPKQQLTKKGAQMAATAINPALGAALKSQTGERLANALVQRRNIISPSLGISPIIPTDVKKEDTKKINDQGEKVENTLGDVSVKISKKVKKILIPVVCSSAGVAFICCIILVAAYSFVSLLGVDLSSQISMDDSIVKGAFEQNGDSILEQLSNMDDIDTDKIGSNKKTGSSGESAKYKTQEEKIKWLYDGKGVPQTKEENDKYLETFSVEILDSDGKPATMNVTMHKKLKKDVQEIFKEMKAAGFKNHGGDISYREWGADGGYGEPFYYSAHTYGHAFDVNPIENCYKPSSGSACTIGNFYKPGVNEYSVTDKIVKIWKNHGFYWGGDWVAPIDYMHFSYFNH